MKRKQREESFGVGAAYDPSLGDGNSWVRGPSIGKGSFGSVFEARLRDSSSTFSCFPPIMAVKSAEISLSATLQREKEVLCSLLACGCPNIIYCFGDEITVAKNGKMFYNLLLELASSGNLTSLIQKCASCGDSVPESDVRRYTRSILRALYHIHGCGYVHCDLKPDNVLLVPAACKGGDSDSVKLVAKIADFGLAKRATMAAFGKSKRRRLSPPNGLRGTALYLSPEAVAEGVQEGAADIWALGCCVLEMLTGRPAWGCEDDFSMDSLLYVIGSGQKLPDIPSEISDEARSFLKGCLVKKAMFRWTAEMLLNHPFVSGIDDDIEDDDQEGESEGSEVCDGDDDSEEEDDGLAVGGGFSFTNRLLSDTAEYEEASVSSYSSIYSSWSESVLSTVDGHEIY